MRFSALALFLLASGCIATPVPEPPNLAVISVEPGTSVLILQGAPGAVEASAELWVVDLDNAAAPQVVRAAADGSFSATLDTAMPGDVLRLQTRLDGERSSPVDVTTPELTPPASPLADCLRLEPGRELDLGEATIGAEAVVGIAAQNDCAGDVQWGTVALRVGGGPYTVEAPADVPAASSGVIRVRFSPVVAGEVEDVLLIAIDAPDAERRAVTLYGRGRAP